MQSPSKFYEMIGVLFREISTLEDIHKIFSLVENNFQSTKGRIISSNFEKYMAEVKKKKTGSYYTPSNICDFICKTTLMEYFSKIEFPINKKNIHIDTCKPPHEWISMNLKIINSKVGENKGSWLFIKEILKCLSNLRILDPAVGTGNFIISMKNTLLFCYDVLLKYVIDEKEYLNKFLQVLGLDLNLLEMDIKKYPGSQDSSLFLLLIEIKIILKHNLSGWDINKDAISVANIRLLIDLLENYPELIIKHKDLRDEFMQLKVFEIGNTLIDAKFNKYKGIFDIIIGNPPYGDLLSKDEKLIVKEYCSYTKEISAAFLMKSMQFNKVRGNLFFFTSYSITFHTYLSNTRMNLRENYEKINISTFDRDKCAFFKGMTQSTSLIHCLNFNEVPIVKPKNNIICTSEMFREIPNLDFIKYKPADKYLLGKIGGRMRVGVDFSNTHRLPKIGSTHQLLDILIENKNNISNILNSAKIKNTHDIWYRSSGNYWYNAWRTQPYESSEVKKLIIMPQYHDLAIILINSQLFYIWMRIYGDGRHLNKDILQSFPIPSFKIIDRFKEKISQMAQTLLDGLSSVFDESHNRFNTSKIKNLLDSADELLVQIYKIPNELYDLIINYDAVVHGIKPK